MDMTDYISDALKTAFLAGVGAVSIAAESAEKLGKEFVAQGQKTVAEGRVYNEELKHTIDELLQQNKKTEPGPTAEEMLVIMQTMSPQEQQRLKAKLDVQHAKDAAEKAQN